MKYFLQLVLIISSCNISAQVNYFQTGATWAYHTEESPEFPFATYRDWLTQLTVTGDTVIQSTNYKKIHNHTKYSIFYPSSPGSNTISYYDIYGLYLRYDSASLKVYLYRDVDSSESLLYNFALLPGDTVPGMFGYVVDSIENISLFGQNERKFHIVGDSVSDIITPIYILDGIGSSIGLTDFDPYILTVSGETYTNLVCFQTGINVYPSGSVCDIFSSTPEDSDRNNFVQIYPNPSYSYIDIAFPQTFQSTIKIFNSFGQLVSERESESNSTSLRINTELLSAGVYFISCDGGDRIYTGRFLKID